MTPRRSLLLLGPLITLGSLGGLWFSALQAERVERDQADAGMGRTAAAYLSVVVPAGSANGYDAARLLAAVNNLERATFWPGGFQLSVGSVPLLPDTIGLVPIPDSVARKLDEGRDPVVVTYPGRRVALVPFLDRDRYAMLGWAAVWGTVHSQLPSLLGIVAAALAAVFALITAVSFAKLTDVRWRALYILCTMGFVGSLAVNLGWSAEQVARAAAEIRILTLKRLVEVAATAPGVRQAMLPEIAVGARVRPLNAVTAAAPDVIWGVDQMGETVTAVAAAPRTASALELTLQPDRKNLDRLSWLLAAWAGGGALGLAITAGGGRYSRRIPPEDRVSAHGDA